MFPVDTAISKHPGQRPNGQISNTWIWLPLMAGTNREIQIDGGCELRDLNLLSAPCLIRHMRLNRRAKLVQFFTETYISMEIKNQQTFWATSTPAPTDARALPAECGDEPGITIGPFRIPVIVSNLVRSPRQNAYTGLVEVRISDGF
jgi:hypothetical protein